MPNVGDELHHFGWNACSSALCPWAPHPHVERRYLLVPGPALLAHPRRRRQGRPAQQPKLVKVDRGRARSRARPATSRPHTIHCGPDGIYVSALGEPGGRRPGRHLPARPRRLLGQGRLGGRPRPAGAGLRLLVAPELRHGASPREWGTPNMVEDGLVGELLLGNQYGHRLHVWDLEQAPPPAGDRPRRRAPDGARAAAGARPAPRPTGSSAWSTSTADLSGLGVAVAARRRRPRVAWRR